MKDDAEHRIVRTMNASMRAQGWPLLTLCGLPLSYAKSTIVTPYFCCSDISWKPYGKYAIEGVIGVVYPGFEVLWMENPERKPIQPGFGVILNILNIPELRERRYVAQTQLEADVAGFCTSVVTMLNGMPQDEPPAARVAELTPRLWKAHFAFSPSRSDLFRPGLTQEAGSPQAGL
jgi:hypothetical protein